MTRIQGRRAIAMLAHSYYDEDPRVRREAEALVAVGHPVDVFALRRPGDTASSDVLGARVHRLDVQRHQGAPLATYLREYLSFFFRAAIALVSAHRRRPYALVQVHTLPDFLVFAAAPVKLVGVPIVLDLHEAMPELFRMRFPGASIAPLRVLVEMQETVSIAFADAVITVTSGVADRLRERGASLEKVTVIHNSPSTALFDPDAKPQRPFMSDGTLRLIYTGVLSPIYELEVALEAVARIREERPGLPVRFDVYGRGDYEPHLREVTTRLGLDDAVTFHGRIPLEEMPAAIAAADIGLAPARQSPFTDLGLSTKVFEYAAMGKPVVASRLVTPGRYFEPDTVLTYPPGEPRELARAILSLVDDPVAASQRVERTALRVGELSWEREAERYVALIDRLIGAKGNAQQKLAGSTEISSESTR